MNNLKLFAIVFAVLVMVGSSVGEEAVDALSPELRKIIFQFSSDDLSLVEDLHRQVGEIEDAKGQILAFLEKGIALGDVNVVVSGMNALGYQPLEPRSHERLRGLIQSELDQLDRLRDARVSIQKKKLESDDELQRRRMPFYCRESFIREMLRFLSSEDEDIVMQYLEAQNSRIISPALNWLLYHGTKASVGPLQNFVDREPFLELPALTDTELALKQRAVEVIDAIEVRGTNGSEMTKSEQSGSIYLRMPRSRK